MKTKLLLSYLATLLFLLVGGAMIAQQEQESVGTNSLSPCRINFSNGTGEQKLKFCITNHGNIAFLEAPQGKQNISTFNIREGYIIGNGTAAFGSDVGNDTNSFGFGAPTISQPNGANTFPLTIRRTAGCLELEQTFARDIAEKDITIAMTLKNICGEPLNDVRVARYFNGDIGGDANGDDFFDRSDVSIWARDADGRNALTLSALSHRPAAQMFPFHATTVQVCCLSSTFGSLDESSTATPTAAGQYDAKVTTHLGTLNPGASRTAKFVYRRM